MPGCQRVHSYPHIAGMLLTGGFKPAPQVQRLIEGLGGSSVPILSVETDTFTTATNVNSVKGTLVPEDAKKMAAAWELSRRASVLTRCRNVF